MSHKYVITELPLQKKDVLFCGLFEDSSLIEANLFSKAHPITLNAIYVAKVSHVVASMQAAFVDIGEGRICYLPLADLKHVIYVKRLSPNKPLVQGDEIVVQIVKEAIKTKNPTVTTKLSLAGVASVVCYGDTRLGISNKLSEEDRQALRELVKPYYDGSLGIVVRTNAATVSKDELLNEIEVLSGQLKEIVRLAGSRTAFSCLYDPGKEYIRILINQKLEQLDEVVTDQKEVYGELQSFSEHHPLMKLSSRIRFYEDPMLELKNLYNVQRELEHALNVKVWLKSGANLFIEPTEALTVIDVNSSKNQSKKNDQAANFKINCEAADMNARQLRLRNISGMILVDFIDMKSAEEKEQLLVRMKRLVRQDPVPCTVVDFTALGLMELTRKKIRPSLRQQFEEI